MATAAACRIGGLTGLGCPLLVNVVIVGCISTVDKEPGMVHIYGVGGVRWCAAVDGG